MHLRLLFVVVTELTLDTIQQKSLFLAFKYSIQKNIKDS